MLEKIISWGLVGLVGLIPLFFLPITSEFYEFNKNALLLAACGLLLLGWVGKMVVNKKVVFRRTAFDLPVLAIALVFIASTVLASVNKWETLWSPQSTGTIIGLTVLYFLITNNLNSQYAIRNTQLALIVSASILALVAILQFVGLGEQLAPPAGGGPDWLKLKTWTPAGNLIALAMFLAAALLSTINQVYPKSEANKQSPAWYFYLLTCLLMATGLGLTVYQLLTVVKPALLPYSTSWAIAIETFKNQPLFGIGPNSFLEAFTRFRPLTFNSTLFWAGRFGVSSSWYLHLMTTVGILGLISFLWLAVKVVRGATPPAGGLAAGPIFLILLMLIFLPANFLILFALWVFLAIYALGLPTKEYTEEGQLLAGIFLFMVLILAGTGLWLGGKAYAGEFFFFQSLKSLAQNKGTDTYNLQIKAISMNPQADFYRLAYSQTNLALANAIAANPAGAGLSDQDRQNISQLVQQAINEAKAGVALNPRRINNWENLAQIYRSLINFAQGADQWTIASYQQAINLDPLNPNLRLNLGGVYYTLGNFDQAANLFQQAVNLKPDFANGHYNLAAALREKKEYENALAEMEVVLALVDPTSGDWQKAKDEVDKLREKVKETEPETLKKPETLAAPSPIPSPAIEPPLQLPEESSPPITNP